MLSECYEKGRLDIVVQSTDKNFMVPVGGTILVSPSKTLIHSIASFYPGRATISPSMDLFITLLSMGIEGLEKLRQERQVNVIIISLEF